MAAGGNKTYVNFFDGHDSNTIEGRTFEESTISERYDCEAAEEWKARLTAKAEEREYIPGEEKKAAPVKKTPAVSSMSSTPRSGTPANGSSAASRSISGLQNSSSRSGSPALGTSSLGSNPSRKTANENYFAKMGAENASRSADLPPSQGGKYGGFGSDWPPEGQGNRGGSSALPSADEFQKDPMAALTKGFGWFTTTVSKGAQEGLKKVSLTVISLHIVYNR